MTRPNRAYEVLSDPEMRAVHDRWIAEQEEEMSQEAEQKTEQSESRPSGPASNSGEAKNKSSDNDVDGADFATDFRHTTNKNSTSSKSSNKQAKIVYWSFMGALALFLFSLSFTLNLRNPTPTLSKANLNTTSPQQHTAKSDSMADQIPTGRAASSFQNQNQIPSDRNAKPYRDRSEPLASAALPSPPPARHKLDVAPNGRPWPKTSAYLAGFKIGATQGHSSIEVSNKENSNAVFGKLILWSPSKPKVVRHFYIAPFGSFTHESEI